MLTEKYRPAQMNDLYGNVRTKEVVSAYIKNNKEKGEKIPHMLFYGPKGTGKTSLAEVIKNETAAEMLELNAGDERKIDVMRGRVKDFTKTKSIDGVPRIVFMDEADALLKDSQNALRRIIEKSNATFILSVNNKNKLSAPLVSRFAKFEFKYPSNDVLKMYVCDVAKIEGIHLTPEILTKISTVCDDYRSALNMLDKIRHMTSITPDDIGPASYIRDIWAALQVTDVRSFNDVVLKVYKDDPSSFVSGMSECVIGSTYDTIRKGKAINVIATADRGIATGASGKIQSMYVLYELRKIFAV